MHPHHHTETPRCRCGHHHEPASAASAHTGCPAIAASLNPIAATERDGAHSASDDSGNADTDDPDSDERASLSRQRFSWIINGMDCPSCARKIETAVKYIPTIDQVNVLFATEKLVVDARTDVREQVQQAVHNVGFTLRTTDTSSSSVSQPSSVMQGNGFLILFALLAMASWMISFISPSKSEAAFFATTLVGLIPVIKKAWQLTRSGSPFAIETLMSVAALGALLIGAITEATVVLLLFMLGERLEAYAAQRARSGVSALMKLLPEEAVTLRGQKRVTVPLTELIPGDIIEVSPGGRLPADARLLTIDASFDESAITGESIPVEHHQGSRIAAGSLCVDHVVQLEVVSQPGNNAIDRMLQLIEEAEERRAPIERFIDRFSRYYTPAIMLISLLVMIVPPLLLSQLWQPWIYRGLALLLIGCPCALVISTPAAITAGLAAAARHGALIKGGAALESLGTLRVIAFDKTGTLTEGKPQVTDIIPAEMVSEMALLGRAAAVESGSHHPLAQAIIQRAQASSKLLPFAEARRTQAGIGVEGQVNGKQIQVSSSSRLPNDVLTPVWQQQIERLEGEGKTVVAVQEENQMLGLLALRDGVRPDASAALESLHNMGIRCVMLTGDNTRAAAAIAQTLGIDYRAGLLPTDKVEAVNALNRQYATAMVGDGINDAPAMKAATIGIAMGNGTDVALETADAALTHSRLTALVTMIDLSRATYRNIRQNVAIALGLKAVFLITTLMGITGLWLAVLADSGATALVTANALRLLRKRD
ncbi:zinc/cadmium/mercury/lead-transporting ATPase [Pectobacteriaceae bacterium CE90]|nr:zinc/cadmium/mercury/lead-transporting ATPase [Pectobacteriaceae bacterium CE90]